MQFTTINANILKSVYRTRNAWAHKGDYGKLLVVGGGLGGFGAPFSVALAAFRSGSDYIKVFGPKGISVASLLAVGIMFYEYSKSMLDAGSIEEIDKFRDWAKVVEVGNGIGTEGTRELVNHIVRTFNKVVLDADGIKVVDKNLIDSHVLITPNSYEFSLLYGSAPSQDLETRAKQVKELANKHNCVVLLKGHYDIISDGKEVFVNKINSVYMAKAGTGDIIAGVVAGLISQGASFLDAARAAAYIVGAAGRLAAKQKREGLIPIDIVETIPQVIMRRSEI
jgi:NAD(P)H-hydrate epimerase